MPNPFIRAQQPTRKEPLITPEADRALLKILIAYGGVFVVLFFLVPVGMAYINEKASPLFAVHRFLDVVSTLIILVPFFLGINAMNASRLQFARRYYAEGNWKAVYGAAETFTQIGQKWMDRDGEAHYLVAIAQERLGYRVEAQKLRAFVTKHRPDSQFAAKLREVEAGRAPRKISEIKASKGVGARKLLKTKRRF